MKSTTLITTLRNQTQAVMLDASSSLGLGHLMRLACLRSALGLPTRMLGTLDALLRKDGLRIRRQTPRQATPETRITVVDRNFIEPGLMAWRLRDRRNRIIWIRRALVTRAQALVQSGFLTFADLLIAPGDLGALDDDPLEGLAARQGKLHKIGVCHAYQLIAPSKVSVTAQVFLSLGAFEEPQQPIYRRIRDLLTAARIPFTWSAYSDLPLAHGFPVSTRVIPERALRVKSQCAAIASEGGYNSLYEALHLHRPMLFVANDGNGREQQSRRIHAAKKISPLVFDASAPGDIEEWIAACRGKPVLSGNESDQNGIFRGGFRQMASIIEGFCVRAQA